MGEGRLSAHFLAVTNTPGDDPARNARIRPQRGAGAGGPAARRAVLLGRGPDAAAGGSARSARHPAVPQAAWQLPGQVGADGGTRRAHRGDVFGRVDAAGDARRAAALCKADLAPTWWGSSRNCKASWAASTRARRGDRGNLEGHLSPLPADRCRRRRPAVARCAGRGDRDLGGGGAGRQGGHRRRLFGAGEKQPDHAILSAFARQAQGMLRISSTCPS